MSAPAWYNEGVEGRGHFSFASKQPLLVECPRPSTRQWQTTDSGFLCALMRRCTKCGLEKPDSQFPRWETWHFCHDCIKAYRRENSREYRLKNPEFLKAHKKRYRQENKEKVLAYQRSYQLSHPEKIREYARRHYYKNPDRQIVHNQKRRARMDNGNGFTELDWAELKRKYNYTCLCCGRREPEIKLSPDHVLPLSKGGSNSIDNIQPLCRTCNNRKYTKHIDYRGAE